MSAKRQYHRPGPGWVRTPAIIELYGKSYGFHALGDPGPISIIPIFYPKSNTDYEIGLLVTDKLEADVGTAIHAAIAGGNFHTTNQPNNDGLEFVSDTAEDVGRVVTFYATYYGTNIVFKESVTLDASDGTTPVASVETAIGKLLGWEVDSAHATAIITIRDASGDAAITTIAAEATSGGITDVVAASQPMGGLPFSAVSDGVSTQTVGAIGEDVFGNEIYGAIALTGATAVLAQKGFHKITKLLTGAVESAQAVSFKIGRLTYGAAPERYTLAGYLDKGQDRAIDPNAESIFYVIVDSLLAEAEGGVLDQLVIEPIY